MNFRIAFHPVITGNSTSAGLPTTDQAQIAHCLNTILLMEQTFL